VKFYQFIHMLTNFGRFILIFNKIALIFQGILIVFTVSSFELQSWKLSAHFRQCWR